MSKWVKISALVIAAAAVVILAYAVLTPEPQADDTDHMGMWGGHMTYSSVNVGLMAASIVAIVVALMVVLLWREYEPLPPYMAAPPLHGPPRADEDEKRPGKEGEGPSQPQTHSPEEQAERNYLVLRLLTGDERVMFKAIMDSGGEALQKDLIQKTRMSDAKVSRLLDRLTQKGVVTKERHGATNKVRIKQD